MTKGLIDLFDLPEMADDETDDDFAIEEYKETLPAASGNPLVDTAMENLNDHSRAMDIIHADPLKHAIDAAELA